MFSQARSVSFFSTADINDEIISLPKETVTAILLQLNLKALAHVIPLICKHFNSIARDDELWSQLFKKHFHVAPMGTDCMEKFIFHYQAEKLIAKVMADDADFNQITNCQELIPPLHDQLVELIKNDHDKRYSIWTNYLYGKCKLASIPLCASPRHKQRALQEAFKYLTKAANKNNPLAMLCLGLTGKLPNTPFTDAHLEWITKAHELGLPEATYELALHCREIDRQNTDETSMKKYYEYLIHAAKRGHAKAAVELADLYISDADKIYSLPYSDDEWAFFDWLISINQDFINKNSASGSRNQLDEKISEEIKPFIAKGVPQAAYFMAGMEMSHESEEDEKSADELMNLAQAFESASLPARKARAMFWYKEAAEVGINEAKEKLKRLETSSEVKTPKI